LSAYKHFEDYRFRQREPSSEHAQTKREMRSLTAEKSRVDQQETPMISPNKKCDKKRGAQPTSPKRKKGKSKIQPKKKKNGGINVPRRGENSKSRKENKNDDVRP